MIIVDNSDLRLSQVDITSQNLPEEYLLLVSTNKLEDGIVKLIHVKRKKFIIPIAIFQYKVHALAFTEIYKKHDI